MEAPWWSLAVSLTALGVSIFTFWWTNVREALALHLVPLARIGNFDGPVFALCNGGKRDLLVTQLLVYFETGSRGSCYYPAVSIQGGTEGQADFIAGGKTVEFRASFLESFGANFAQGGVKGDPWPELYSHYIGIEVEWVSPGGQVRMARVLHSRLGFAADGKIRGKAPLSKDQVAYNLYEAAT
ncbi:MAG: hypothetical protein A0129_15095 [Limnobacter sp. CACIAM 66H1]|nr:MAG: hypothetical protein A0129_15095 [Limnobacter sp. CACIAM 66H1]